MPHTELNSQEIATPEVVSPTAHWAKPKFKGGLKLKQKLKLRDESEERRSIKPTQQPKLNRIRANEKEMIEAMFDLNASIDTTRKLHSRLFNGLAEK